MSDSPGVMGLSFGSVWTGNTLPPPALLAMAMSDPEDRPPLRRSDHEFCTCWECSQPQPHFYFEPFMPQDNEITETLAPPTDRAERTTEPPDPAEEARITATMLPPDNRLAALEPSPDVEKDPKGPGGAPPSDLWLAAYDKLVAIHEEQKQRDNDLYNEDGKFAELMGNVIERRFERFAQKLEPRFVGIERDLRDLKREYDRRFEALEREMRELRANAPRAPETTTAAKPA